MKYHIFNPESDFALALGAQHYCAPRNILRFREDLSLLPIWYADTEDFVIVEGDIPAAWIQDIRKELLNGVSWVKNSSQLKKAKISLRPWGWNYSFCKEWNVKGVDCEKLRELSGRSISITLLSFLKEQGFTFHEGFVMPEKIVQESDIKSFLQQNPSIVLKLPWSSSGKGLKVVENGILDELSQKWVANGLLRQGFIMSEKLYQKNTDFAMEFFCGGGECRFVGYSLFQTQKGKYEGNMLMSDKAIEEHLCALGGIRVKPILENLKQWIATFLSQHIGPFYQGFAGVDMMLVEEGGALHIHPCVELNLRMNMGCVSRIFYDRYVQYGKKGVFKVLNFRKHEELKKFHEEKQLEYPLEIHGHKISSGYLPLTYIQDGSLSLACVWVG